MLTTRLLGCSARVEPFSKKARVERHEDKRNTDCEPVTLNTPDFAAALERRVLNRRTTNVEAMAKRIADGA